MTNVATIKLVLIILISLSITGCINIPKVLQGEYSTISPLQSKTNHAMNEDIRWSGYIIQTTNYKDKTCFEVVETDTYDDLRPKRIIPEESSRYLACKDGFLEPHAFNKRLVTITGTLVAYTEQMVGEYNYEYPVVKTDKIYIWRKTPRYNYSQFSQLNFAYYPFAPFSCRFSSISGYCY